MFKIILTVLLLMGQTAIPQYRTEAPWPREEWPRSTPEEQGLDSRLLQELVEMIHDGEYRHLHGLLVIRHGYLVTEAYFGGYHADSLHTLQSVSKSFTSAFIGIAIEQGKIDGVHERILDIFSDMDDIQNMDDGKQSIRLEDLLTMRTGTDYHEGYDGSPHDRLNHLETGWDRFYLNRPMRCRPGTGFQYDSGGVILMSAILKKRTGFHADDFADRTLFPQLGILRRRWFKNAEGHPHTGGGLHLLPRDMAKFGLLYLRGGRWEDRQVVPAAWVEESFKMHVSFSDRRGGHDVGYGYLWWILEPDPQGSKDRYVYAAKGYMGQYIFIIPEHDMVVVVTGGARSGRDMRRPVDFLYSHVLKALKR